MTLTTQQWTYIKEAAIIVALLGLIGLALVLRARLIAFAVS
jgi:hypothetical protein